MMDERREVEKGWVNSLVAGTSRDRGTKACRWQIEWWACEGTERKEHLHSSLVVSFVQAVCQADLLIHSETPAFGQDMHLGKSALLYESGATHYLRRCTT